ncbi:hypothetical protein EKO04_010499 [Ascochyta lentis]|uniref:Uncharacterized protein n=1 Tax=Ascochyta lentis TaxID=205686 RepID=A0A8H7IVY0_9PLEO|nr:hypothetical protein EKO04_010499 [Ascochyta lentis]
MFGQTSQSARLPPCSSEEQLYQTSLDACIEGIENLPVDKRQRLSEGHFVVKTFAKRTVTSPAPVDSSGSLPSPPLSPRRPMWSSPPPLPLSTSTAAMNRSSLHGGPTRDTRGHQNATSSPDASRSQDSRSSQDARYSQDTQSNFAVQPAANVGTFKLKKNAVKIVSAGTPLLRAPQRPVTPASSRGTMPLPTPVSLPAPGLPRAHQTRSHENERLEATRPAVNSSQPRSVPALPPSRIELPPPTLVAKSSLEDMFARLSGASSATPSRPAEEFSPAGPDKSMFSFEDALSTRTATTSSSHDQVKTQHLQDRSAEPPSTLSVQDPPSIDCHGKSQDELEQEYLLKAAEYVSALPPSNDNIAQSIKTVSNKLKASYAPNLTRPSPDEVDKLRARCVFAVVTYVNKKVNISQEPLTADFVKKALHDNGGSFLKLCASLVEGNYISLKNIQHVVGVCKNILDVLPKAEGSLAGQPNTAGASVSKANPVTSTDHRTSAGNLAYADPIDGMKAWPSQEKRAHGVVYRTCVLKGVSGVKSLNELQALVWGGRLESISMPEAGSEHALVKFLTPKACQSYLDATENGIEVHGDTKKTIVFVDKQPEPNSVNDVIQNCIDGDASRCIRATGADDDWSDEALFILARGKQQIKRDVDRIKQGKTARGHHFVEFRFGNIYHALNFKRYLMDDEEWEHCSIGYAPDPCELARGVHYKDEDEASGGLT